MGVNWGGVAQGYNQYLDDSDKRAQLEQLMALRAMEMKRQQAMDQARSGAGNVLDQAFKPAPPMQQTPMPGQSSAPMGSPQAPQPPQPPGQNVQFQNPNPTARNASLDFRGMSPPQVQSMLQSIQNPAEKQKALQAMGQAKQQIPPYQSVGGPQSPPQAPNQAMAPPAMPPAMPQKPPDQDGQSQLMPNIIQALKSSGVPKEQWLDYLETMKPVFDQANQEKLTDLRVTQSAQKAAHETFLDYIQNDRERRLRDQGQERLDQGQEKLDVAKQKAESEVKMGKISPETIDYYAKQSLAGDNSWQVGLARGKVGQALISAVKDRIPQMAGEQGVSPEEALANKAGRTSNQAALTQNTKDMAAIRPYKEMLDKNAGILKDLAVKVTKTNAPYANKTLNWLKTKASSDPDVTEFMAQMRIFQTEAARVLNNPRLTGQLTDSARGELESIINGEMSLDATVRVVNRLQSDGDNRIKSMDDERGRLTKSLGAKGAKTIDFNDLK